MKPFRFSLERILDLRRRRLEEAEAEMARALAEVRATAERAAAIDHESALLDEGLRSNASWKGRDLAAGDAWRHKLTDQRRVVEAEGRRRQSHVEELRRKLTAARIDLRALESLRDRRLADWRRELSREEEALAGELFLARWKRKSG
ncbi:MAG: hypothetical protein GC160_21160 [Acidobacteria bacterium]|nr:hypothetical protein [Acidobacteriota bacterium]